MRARLRLLPLLLTLLLSAWSGRAAAQARPESRPEPAAAASETPRVRLIATGGTISNKAGGRLTADELVALAPDIGRWARPETEQFANVASSELTLDQWRAQIARIPGGSRALMPFYGRTPDEAARQLSRWLSLAHGRPASQV